MATNTMTGRRALPRTSDETMARYPALTAHVICQSLGYFSPHGAASAILDHLHGRGGCSEWHLHIARGGKSLREVNSDMIAQAAARRHFHRGYMASYAAARRLVDETLKNNGRPVTIFGSW